MVQQFLVITQKVKIELPYHSAILLLGVNAIELEIYVHTKIYTQMFIASKWKQLKWLSID